MRGRRAIAGLAVVVAGLWGCVGSHERRVAVVRARLPEVQRLHAPRVRCDAPGRPVLSPGWSVTQWPTVPRMTTVEARANVLFGTTSSAVCQSVDGGSQWRTLIEDLEYPSITLSANNVLVVRSGIAPDGSAVSGAPVLWWTSVDGGEQWRQSTEAPEEPSGRALAAMREDRRVVLCGGALFTTVERGGHTGVLQSADGGESWRRQRAVGELAEGVRPRCVASGVVMLEGRDRLPVAVSRDAGATWRSVRPPPVEVVEDDEEADGNTVGEERGRGCVPLGTRGLFCEISGQTYLSDDDGRRWRLGHSPVGGRAILQHGARIVGVGGGVAESEDGGRRWSLVAPAEGAVNLGVRGGILDAMTYWIAGAGLWWTDDGGEHWRATLLPFQLVEVFSQRRLVGVASVGNGRCARRVEVSVNGGRTWRRAIRAAVGGVRSVGGSVEVVPCTGTRGWVTRDGVRWRRGVVLAEPLASPDESPGVFTNERIGIDATGGVLRTVSRDGDVEVIARRWPAHLVPVAARSEHGVVEIVLFGNGTVLRRRGSETSGVTAQTAL